jgi:hypothetical protein
LTIHITQFVDERQQIPVCLLTCRIDELMPVKVRVTCVDAGRHIDTASSDERRRHFASTGVDTKAAKVEADRN